jgi:hypothetical protein
VFLPFFLFGDFRSLFLEFPRGRFEGVSLRDSCWMSLMRTLCLFDGDLDPTNPPKRLRFGCFRWFPWEGVLEG